MRKERMKPRVAWQMQRFKGSKRLMIWDKDKVVKVEEVSRKATKARRWSGISKTCKNKSMLRKLKLLSCSQAST